MVYDIEKVQAHLLTMMSEFHSICVENNLKYYIVGGTCIGALRHKGFIPWDDDVDIAMPRDDYDKLSKLSWGKISNKLEIKYYKNTDGSPIHYIKVVDKTTTLIEERYHNYVEGLYLDIFPLDGINENDSKRPKKIWMLHSMIMRHCSTAKRDRGGKTIISKMIPVSWMHHILEKEMRKIPYNKSEYVVNFLGAYGKKEIVQKRLFGLPKLYEFQGNVFYGPEDADSYLNKIYGDYMELPPIEKRIFKHNYFHIDLLSPYREWGKNGQRNE